LIEVIKYIQEKLKTGKVGDSMKQERTRYNIRSLTLQKIVISFCMIYPASIIAQQDTAAIENQNPTVYNHPVPFAQQDDGMPNYNTAQDMSEPPPGPYQALPDLYPYAETDMYPDRQDYSMPPSSAEQGVGQASRIPVAPPVDSSAYAYPQYAPPQAPGGSQGFYAYPPQYGQGQGYPGYEGGNYGYSQPPAYAYPPPGEYQYRAPQGYQGYYQGQPNIPADSRYGGQRAYPPSGYAYPQGYGSPVYRNRYPGMEANPVKPQNTGQ
jgi:hypothetical protein